MAQNIYPIIIFSIGFIGLIAIIYSIPLIQNYFKKKEEIVQLELDEELKKTQFQESQEKKQLFLQSSEYIFVQQFSKKYKTKSNSDDFSKLETLLQKNQWTFSTDELKEILSEEKYKQKAENIKSKILATNPTTLEDYIRNFIGIFGNNNEHLHILADLLRSNGVYDSSNIWELEHELSEINEKIELESFEKRLLDDVNQITINEIDSLGGYEFEEFLKNLFSKMGYQVEQTKLSGDQGADLVVKKFGEITVIQAKRYGGKVGNNAVQEIMAAISIYKAHRGMVVTNNYFTPAAVELAKANTIELIDRESLKNMIENYW